MPDVASVCVECWAVSLSHAEHTRTRAARREAGWHKYGGGVGWMMTVAPTTTHVFANFDAGGWRCVWAGVPEADVRGREAGGDPGSNAMAGPDPLSWIMAGQDPGSGGGAAANTYYSCPGRRCGSSSSRDAAVAAVAAETAVCLYLI